MPIARSLVATVFAILLGGCGCMIEDVCSRAEFTAYEGPEFPPENVAVLDFGDCTKVFASPCSGVTVSGQGDVGKNLLKEGGIARILPGRHSLHVWPPHLRGTIDFEPGHKYVLAYESRGNIPVYKLVDETTGKIVLGR